MKILQVPLNYGPVDYFCLTEAFREHGCEVESFDYFDLFHRGNPNQTINQMFINKVREFQPNIVTLQIQHTTILTPDTIKQAKAICPNAKFVQHTIDIRSQPQQTYKAISEYCDYNLICSTGQLEMHRNSGIKNVKYWPPGFDPKNYFPTDKKDNFPADVVFLANVNTIEGYPGSNERIESAKLLRKAFGERFYLHGNYWNSVPGMTCKGEIEIKNSCREGYHNGFCALSISHFNNIAHYYSDRLLFCLASGRPTISYYFPEIEDYFVDGRDLLIARSPQEVVDKVQWCLNNKERANIIGMNGAAKVFAEHTYNSRVKWLFNIIGV